MTEVVGAPDGGGPSVAPVTENPWTSTEVESLGGGRYAATIGESWQLLLVPQGGVLAAIAARAMAEAASHIAPGVTTDELDRIAHTYMCDHGAYPSTLGYRKFPKSLCASINEVICHGIPDSTELRDGDIVNLDVTAFIGGVHGDTNATYFCGEVDEESRDGRMHGVSFRWRRRGRFMAW